METKGENMTYDEFIDFVCAKCVYETIYKDSEGRIILVINLLDAYELVRRLNLATMFQPDAQKSVDQHKDGN
jgi:hypothetical protein